MRRGATTVFLLAAAAAATVPPSARAGAITFNTALPVHSGETIVREQVIWLRATDDPTSSHRELDVVSAPTVLVYGASPRWTLFGVIPVLDKRLELATPDGRRVERTASGLGDARAFVRATALEIDRPGETLRLAPFAGVKLPTGADDDADRLGRLPRPLQLGTGSWDPLGGLIFTWQTLGWELDTSASYQLRTEAHGVDGGDEARGDASFQYRVWPWREIGPGVPDWLFAVVETNAVWRGKDEVAGTADPDSGGFEAYVAPGLQWITLRTVLEAAVQIPVVQHVDGRGLGDDFIARLSFRMNF